MGNKTFITGKVYFSKVKFKMVREVICSLAFDDNQISGIILKKKINHQKS